MMWVRMAGFRLSLLLIVCAGTASACFCTGAWGTPREAWRESAAVFVGTVIEAEPDGPRRDLTFQEQVVRIRVNEAFKAVTAGQTITMRLGSSDCAPKFGRGERRVFYMRANEEGAWYLPSCMRTLGNAEPGSNDMLFLRGLPRSAKGTRVAGDVRGAPHLAVTITGPGGFSRQLVTSKAGGFEVYNLKRGSYSVSVNVPRGFKLRPSETPSEFELGKDGDVSLSFVLEDDTSVAGRVLDSSGIPVQGVCVDLEPVQGRSPNREHLFGCTDETGAFAIDAMPPGQYLLKAKDKIQVAGDKSESTLYYPGVRERQRATVITIDTGQHARDFDIRTPALEKRYRVAGHVQFSDGVPAAAATVKFESREHGYVETAGTDERGEFRLFGVAGMRGELTAKVAVFWGRLRRCPGLNALVRPGEQVLFLDTNSVPMTFEADRAQVTLHLPQRFCPQ